ncbi:MAG TPA: hypothetical protein VI542_11940 [Candidatus Tectomicrobia bacterium]
MGPTPSKVRSCLTAASSGGAPSASGSSVRPLQAHCHRGLGTLYATISQQEQARTELSTAIELYTSMDMTFWLPHTETALAQVDA